jgi:hypothetical protein
MNTSHRRRISRRAAEQLFAAGAPDMIPDPVTRLLAAAAAPARERELAREDMAASAFRAEHLVPVTDPGRGEMISSPLAKLLTTKAAAIVMAVTATGGVAVAATVSMNSSGPAAGHVSAHAGPGTGVQAHGSVKASMPAAGQGQAGGSGQHPGPAQNGTTVHLCTSLTKQVHTAIVGQAAGAAGQVLGTAGLEQALRSPLLAKVLSGGGFGRLISEAAGSGNVADLCGITLKLPTLPNPAAVMALPAAVLAEIPVATLVTLPTSVLAQLPTSVLEQLPVSTLQRLPVSVLKKLPVSTLTELPTSVLATLPIGTLTELPTSVLARLPIPVVSELPVPSLVNMPLSVLEQLPVATLEQLPASVLAKLPVSVLTKLPVSSLVKLPVSVLAKLPISTLETLPASVLQKLPASILAQLPKGLL